MIQFTRAEVALLKDTVETVMAEYEEFNREYDTVVSGDTDDLLESSYQLLKEKLGSKDEEL